jgi:tRNA(fMet)-specific endonuclease VapC
MILIDSSVLIAAERGDLDFGSLLAQPRGEEVAIAAITAAELLHGVFRAGAPARRARREAFVERLLELLPVLPFDLTVARIHARVWASLATRGVTLGTHDLLIGATALAHAASVATRDARSFARIPGLAWRRL